MILHVVSKNIEGMSNTPVFEKIKSFAIDATIKIMLWNVIPVVVDILKE